MVGWTDETGRLRMEEVFRFENDLVKRAGHLCWDIDSLVANVVAGMRAAHERGYDPETVGIDTWGVDYVLLDVDGLRIGDAVAYRDARTEGVRDALDADGTLSPSEHYARTGIQYQPFNTVYQLVAQMREHPEQLAAARAFLMVPDYLNWLLCGVAANEYTNASTTALVNVETRDWDECLVARLGLPREVFLPIRQPGEVLGDLLPEIAEEVGFSCRVMLPATHDTGSAWLAVPAPDADSVYLSSGTWSLMGVENTTPITDSRSAAGNFTNEGGAFGTLRYLKNIMGLWMVQRINKELGHPGFPGLIEAALESSEFSSVVDVDDPRFLAPPSMVEEVKAACLDSGQLAPVTTGEIMQCVYNSLAVDYAAVLSALEELTGRRYRRINAVGGGTRDLYLAQRMSAACGLPVLLGPTEGTAVGNIVVQLISSGELPSLSSARAAIRSSFDIKEVRPDE